MQLQTVLQFLFSIFQYWLKPFLYKLLWFAVITTEKAKCSTVQRRLDPGKETLEGFFKVGNQKEYRDVVMISFVHLEKINIFCFMHKSVAQKLSLPHPLKTKL